MEKVVRLNELTSRREKLKVISMLGQEIIKDTVQVSKDRAEYYLDSDSSLIHKKRRTNKE